MSWIGTYFASAPIARREGDLPSVEVVDGPGHAGVEELPRRLDALQHDLVVDLNLCVGTAEGEKQRPACVHNGGKGVRLSECHPNITQKHQIR